MIKLGNGDLSVMKSELQGFRDPSAFRHFEIGVFIFGYYLGREKHLGEKTPDQSEWSVMVIPDSIFEKPGKT